ncbi:MAG: 50S ribosomal protein L1 [Malacoplasma sp.]
MKKALDFNKNKAYPILEAIDIAKKNSTTKFVSSIDVAIKLNLDTAKAEQQLRGTLSLPHFFGKKKKILVLDSNLTKNDAKSFDVDFAGGKEVIDEISKGWLAFDLIITTPKMMPELSKLGKILGTRGLMPSPKNGNVTTNLKKTIEDFKSGITQYRTDSYGNVHILVGKSNVDSKKIEENINFILDFLKSKKPSVVKGVYIQNVSISSTMGPGVKIAMQKNTDSEVKGKKRQKAKTINKKKHIEPIIKIVYESNTKTSTNKYVNVNKSNVVTVKKQPKLNVNKTITNKKPNAPKVGEIKQTTKPVINFSNKKVETKITNTKPAINLEKAKTQVATTKNKVTKPLVKPETKKPLAKQEVKKTIAKPEIKKPLAKQEVKKPSISKNVKVADKKVVKVVSKPTKDTKVKKVSSSKSPEKKIDDKKVQTNKKITKTIIKKENSSKKVAPRKIEIKKINKSK